MRFAGQETEPVAGDLVAQRYGKMKRVTETFNVMQEHAFHDDLRAESCLCNELRPKSRLENAFRPKTAGAGRRSASPRPSTSCRLDPMPLLKQFQTKKLPSNSHFGLESSLYGKMKRVTETLNVMQVIWAHLRLQSAGGIIMLTQG